MRAATIALLVTVGATASCAAILGIRDQDPARPFEHRAHAAAGVHCLSCHDGIRTDGDEDEVAWPSKATCVRCHKKPHDERACGTCHGLPFNRGGAERARRVLRFDHGAHVKKTGADCIRCHADSLSGATVLRPKMATCLGCHGHDEDFAVKDCNRCHADMREEGSMPEDHFVHGEGFADHHASAAERSDGMCTTCHSDRFCASCHTGSMMPAVPARLSFDVPKGSGLHRAGFMARHANESRNQPGLCTTCHAPESCQSCHERQTLVPPKERTDDAIFKNPHPEGWVGLKGERNDHGPATLRDPASCAGCHGGAGEQLCVKCHQVGAPGGSPHPLGHPPNGSRAQLPCSRCHTQGR